MRDMGGGGGNIYTAYTKLPRFVCKLDSLALLNRLYGLECEIYYVESWTAPEVYICFTPWRVSK